MSCCDPPPLPFIRMLSQASLLVSRTPSTFADDENNNNNKFKMMVSRGAHGAALINAMAGPKRCLFGAPSPSETQRLVREDQDAAKARMARRWGWDLGLERPCTSPSSTWQWESVRVRRHPYAKTSAAHERVISPMTVPAPISPLPATPTAVLNSSATSSSSGTSTLPESPSTPEALPSSWRLESEDSCCGDSDSDSDSDSSTSCNTSSRPRRPPQSAVPVQTRITDFWRTRRCSVSESAVVKPNPGPCPGPPPARLSVRTCSV